MLTDAIIDYRSPSSSTSSVSIWLDTHPDDPEGYTNIQTLCQNSGRCQRKRQNQLQEQEGHPETPNKRRRLAAITPNGMPGQSGLSWREEEEKGYTKKRRLSPEKTGRGKRSRIHPDNTGENPQSPVQEKEKEKEKPEQRHRSPLRETRGRRNESRAGIYTIERTPSPSLDNKDEATPTQKLFGPIPKLNPTTQLRHVTTTSANESLPSSTLSEGSIHSASSVRSGSTRSGRSSPSRSPVKAMGDLYLTDIRVSLNLFATNKRTLPPATQSLYVDLRRIAQAKHTIPHIFKQKVVAETEEADLLSEDAFAPADRLEDEELAKDPVALEIFWASIVALQASSLECDEDCLSEAAWNANVHAAIIRLTLSGRWKQKGVWYHDITSARVSDTTLLPTVATGTTQSKMVDLSFYIHRNAKLEKKILERCQAKKIRSITQTMAEYARFTPLSVSIETKRGAIGEGEAHIQLALWVSAHYAKLRQLTKKGTQMPWLPLLKVQGHEWKFLLAEHVDVEQIVILKEVRVGSTESIQGIFQVIAALRRLARWTDEVYRPWFDKYVLST